MEASCWGYNQAGTRLGDGTYDNRYVPIQLLDFNLDWMQSELLSSALSHMRSAFNTHDSCFTSNEVARLGVERIDGFLVYQHHTQSQNGRRPALHH